MNGLAHSDDAILAFLNSWRLSEVGVCIQGLLSLLRRLRKRHSEVRVRSGRYCHCLCALSFFACDDGAGVIAMHQMLGGG